MSSSSEETENKNKEIKEELENPFEKNVNGCDVIVIVDDYKLHLHSNILTLYSPAFENMLNNGTCNTQTQQELHFKGKNIKHVIELFKYFYPDKLQVTNEETNFRELLALVTEYHVTWLTNHFEDYLVTTVSQDRLFLCSKNINSLQLADIFNLKTLRAKLLSFKSYESFKSLQKIEGFQQLESSTMYEIAKIRIRTQLENKADECNAIIKQLDIMFYQEDTPRIVPIHRVVTKDKKIIDNPFAKPEKNSDVLVKVENHELHLHSAVLSLYSPVFQVMLSGNFKEGITKEVHLIEKEAEYVIEMFRYLYANQFQKVNAHSNFKELLSLCDEYHITWLTNHIEDYLVTKAFAKGYDDGKNVWGLQLSDRFHLMQLRTKLLQFTYSTFSKIQVYDDFQLLANKTKYQIAKQRIKAIFPKVETQQYNIYSKNYVTRWVESEECNAIINFLDTIFLEGSME